MNVNYDEPIKNLPDAYDKNTDSNNYKLLRINKNTTDIIEQTSKKIFDTLNLNNAGGRVLDDVWGGRVNLKRGKLNDEQYVIRLRTKMMQDTANGSFPDLVEALAYALQCEKSSIHLVESDTPNKIIIKDIPLGIVFEVGFTIDDVVSMIESMLPVGVKIERQHFTGTFEYGEITDTEYTETAGYADLDGAIGGYYGLLDE
ncbi:MAG: hypothetical protein Q4G33_04000 [bacterium]|nr:hypothetical protein [bacterium]